MTSPFHVVVGAGATGVATALLLAEAGDRVRLVSRRGSGPDHPRVERVAASAADPDALTALTEGAGTLTNCAAPPYDRWPAEFPPLAASLLTAAERTGTPYVMLGNLYAYGEGPVGDGQPFAPTTVKGRLRAAIWAEAAAAGIRVTEVRAAAFVGAAAVSLYTLMVAPRVLAGEPAAFPGDLEAPQSWSYVGDVARALVAAGRSEAVWGRGWLVPSPTASVRELTEALAAAAGKPAPSLLRMTREELVALGADTPVVAEVVEMLPSMEHPHVVDAAESERVLGVHATPLADVVAEMAGR